MHQFFIIGPHMLTQVLSHCANTCLCFAYLLASVWVKCLLTIFFDQIWFFFQLLGKGCTHQHKADETGNEQTCPFFLQSPCRRGLPSSVPLSHLPALRQQPAQYFFPFISYQYNYTGI